MKDENITKYIQAASRHAMTRRGFLGAMGVGASAGLFGLSACAGAGSTGGSSGGKPGGGGGGTLRVLMANNPQMGPLQALTNEFTEKTGIKVSYTKLPENDLRDKVNQEYSSQAGQYDVTSLSAFEVPIFSKNGWMVPLDSYLDKTPEFDQNDIFPAFTKGLSGPDNKIYAEPFYGESSFTMYRKDLFKKKGLTMPDRPTWDQLVTLSSKINNVEPDVAGIALRGMAGWGQNLAPLNTVINTYGGGWFDMDWNPRLSSAQTEQATQMYVDLVRKYGEPGAAQSGVQECINIMLQGKAAIFYDATSIAGLMEAKDSKVRGKMGYVAAPTNKTDYSGWLWTWAWGIPKSSANADAAWKFIAWASSKDFEKRVGDDPKYGWTLATTGKRRSTYKQPGYIKAAGAYYKQEKDALDHANPQHPGVDPQPYNGIQFVGIPEFPDLGTQVSQQISSAIAGKITVKQALATSQKLAIPVGKAHRGQ